MRIADREVVIPKEAPQVLTRGYSLIGLALLVIVVGALADDADDGARQVTVRAIEGAADGPRSWALVIGVSQYEADEIADLKYAAADARALADLLRDPQRGGYETVVLLSDDQTDPALRPTVPNIIGQLQYAKNYLRGMDRVMVSFSGHGGTIAGQQCLLASDTRWVGEGPLANDLIRLADVTAMLDAVGARQSVVVMDACRNELMKEGKSADAADGVSAEFEAELGGMARGEGRAVIASAQRGQKSYEWEEQTHGVFTYYLLQAISGEADDDSDGAVTLSEANGYLASAMQQWSAEHAKQQSPAIMQSEVTGEITLAGTPRAAKMGTLSIETEPEGAAVFVDGREVGVSPLQVGMTAGEHQLMVRAAGFAELARPVIVAGEGTTPVRLTLSQVTGSLTVVSQPAGGTVYVDGVERGATPLDIEQLAPGEHSVRVAMADHFDYEATVNVRAGANLPLTGLLQALREAPRPDAPQAQTGFLYVTSEPADVEVWMDGRRVGVTPLTLKSVSVGEHLVQLRTDLWENWEQRIAIEPMAVAKVHGGLSRATGRMDIELDIPGADVLLDGKSVRKGPAATGGQQAAQAPVDVVAGKHEIVLKLAYGCEVRREVYVPKGQTVRVPLLRAELTGTVTVLGEGAEGLPVSIGGQRTQETLPATLLGVPVGERMVTASGEGKHYQAEVEVLGGRTTLAVLQPGEPPEAVTAPTAGTPTPAVTGGKPWERSGSRAGEEIVGPGGIALVWVPGGSFQMGGEDGDSDEKPVHRVELSGFWIGKTEVTVAQWQSVMGSAPNNQQGDDHPVVYVSWNDVKKFCDKLGVQLPTEAQWEYAARGPDSRRYPWGDTWDEKKCCSTRNHGPGGRTFPVGHFRSGASWCGALDMAGNVWEWCADWYADWYDRDYYASSPAKDPAGPASGGARVLRGGSRYNDALNCRSANRDNLVPTSTDNCIGFRLSRS